VMTDGTTQPAESKGPLLHLRIPGKGGTLTSAGTTARSVRHVEYVEPVRALQRVLYRSAKQEPDRRFHALYDKLTRSDVMWRAWCDVAANKGAPGVDGVSVGVIAEGDPRAFLEGLAEELRAGSYRPMPLRRVHIPKPGKAGETRPLGIPTVKDRVAMAAAKIVLEPVFEADFSPQSFGFRPKRSAHQALEAVRLAANKGLVWVLDADIKACFDEIDREALMARIELRVSDRKMLKLLKSWLRAGFFEGGVVSDTGVGTPQGSPLSPLLANIALHVLDEAWSGDGRRLGTLVRYADDFVVLCGTRERAEAARDLAAATLVPLGLRLHPDKTRIVCLRNGEDGFDFLGFHHRMRESRRYKGRRYLHKWPSPKAMASIKAKVRERTRRSLSILELGYVVDRLNPVLRGWGAYFRHGNSSRKFTQIDSYVAERLAILASTKRGESGRNWGTRYNYRWYRRLGVYQLTGTVAHRTAHALR
jgi:RNA-directed DNA polymerase